jgi:hypothetical protein
VRVKAQLCFIGWSVPTGDWHTTHLFSSDLSREAPDPAPRLPKTGTPGLERQVLLLRTGHSASPFFLTSDFGVPPKVIPSSRA